MSLTLSRARLKAKSRIAAVAFMASAACVTGIVVAPATASAYVYGACPNPHMRCNDVDTITQAVPPWNTRDWPTTRTVIPRQVPNPGNTTYYNTIVETLTGGEVYRDQDAQIRNYLVRLEGRQGNNARMYSYDADWTPNGQGRGPYRIVRADLGYVVYTFGTTDHYENFTYLYKTFNDELR